MIRAILLDSGRVLNGPWTGHWFITPNFFKYVHKDTFYKISKEDRKRAFKAAGNYIHKQLLIETEHEEYEHFLEYYRLLFSKLPQLHMDKDKIELVAKDLVFNYEKYRFFDDVEDFLGSVTEKYLLAVVSDAWPSLENVFVNAGYRGYFASFIISSQLGVTKPHEGMYMEALKELNVKPEEAVFIDDNKRNCDGARRLGIKTYLLCRDWKMYIYYKVTCQGHKVIYSLKHVKRDIDKGVMR